MYLFASYISLANLRSCRFAWAQMYLVLAALVKEFDFTVEVATAKDFEAAMDNFAIGTKAGPNIYAKVSMHAG